MAGLLLLLRKSEVEGKLTEAKSVLSSLESVKNTFTTLLNELNTSVLTGEDTNFNTAEEMVKSDIEATDAAIKDAEQARDTLEQTVAKYDEYAEQGMKTLQSGIQAAKDYIKAAKDVRSVL